MTQETDYNGSNITIPLRKLSYLIEPLGSRLQKIG